MRQEFPGRCPLCNEQVIFWAENDWYRDSLFCPSCVGPFGGSVVRERALVRAMKLFSILPSECDVHEVAPAERGASVWLSLNAKTYVASNYWPDRPFGSLIGKQRNENAEAQTFESESFDLVVHMDVMEHVNDPAAVIRETRRTLRPNGWQVFSAPTHKDFLVSRQVARNTPEGETILEGQAEYHGNPISGQGSLVTWRLGYDFANIVTQCGFDVTVLRFDAPTFGLIGEFTEIYVCQKR